jgi:hypothetical protein
MLIRNSTWERIRDQFTEEEKADLRMCVVSKCICPPGFMIEEDDVQPTLLNKLKFAMRRFD